MALFQAPTVNFKQTSLNGAITDSATTITLASTANMQAPGYIVIDRIDSSNTLSPNAREVVYFTGISSNDLTGCTRAADNSTARSHSSGAIVETTPTVGMWNGMVSSISNFADDNGYIKAINSPVSIAIGRFTQFDTPSIASIARLELARGEFKQFALSSVASIANAQVATGEFVRFATPSLASIAVVASPAIQFPATQVDSSNANTLDDYEEGTWTPVLTFTTPGNLSVAYSLQSGTYTKIGRICVLNYLVLTSTFTHTTASGDCRLTGLPFTAAGNYAGALDWQGITKANYTNIVAKTNGGTYLEFYAFGSGQNRTTVAAADMPTTGTVALIGTITMTI